ncbi:DUF294 nucleotidyltransferase-like domain-containing protein [Candidatus Thiosymbion oneisti]|uniref:DUF294 nucleotidyltransferase-like domain-containing protein n=1 Tax=Candidatus Thiosymbion oneisti TaxID=589554 RepID=UPI000B7D9C58|nr:DUF294 nucleotidyltransferase-like domain-containing protein [Candidatus Thiosymbion oneisti]
MQIKNLESYLDARTFKTYIRAQDHCSQLCADTQRCVEEYLKEHRLNHANICLVAVGSVGRQEALEASDLDIIPVLSSKTTTVDFERHDRALRERISNDLGIKVSEGKDLTRFVDIARLTDPDTIGGDEDDSQALTKRILILLESTQVGGGYPIRKVREKILEAYAESERTRGRHVLSLCNDLARYFRTLCIEYKAKVDVQSKDWCTRNLKLRHTRKIWYFSCMLSVVSLAQEYTGGEARYFEGLLENFSLPPILRIAKVTGDSQKMAVSRLLKHYAYFLEFMSQEKHRSALSKVDHDQRYDAEIQNPFPGMKFNSDLMHHDMMQIIEGLNLHIRRRVFDWFLL